MYSSISLPPHDDEVDSKREDGEQRLCVAVGACVCAYVRINWVLNV